MARVNILSNPDTRPDTLDLALMAIDDEKVDFNKKIEPFIKDILTSNEFSSQMKINSVTVLKKYCYQLMIYI